MGPFLLFGGDTSYPLGGWLDFKGQFDTAEAARLAVQDIEVQNHVDPWYEIVDLETLMIVDKR